MEQEWRVQVAVETERPKSGSVKSDKSGAGRGYKKIGGMGRLQ